MNIMDWIRNVKDRKERKEITELTEKKNPKSALIYLEERIREWLIYKSLKLIQAIIRTRLTVLEN